MDKIEHEEPIKERESEDLISAEQEQQSLQNSEAVTKTGPKVSVSETLDEIHDPSVPNEPVVVPPQQLPDIDASQVKKKRKK